MKKKSLVIIIIFSLFLSSNIFGQETSLVISPDIPKSMTFCGKPIDLTRFDVRERMDRELLAFSYMHSSTLKMIKKANRYFPILLPILRSYKIPEDFIYLMTIESGMDIKAYSPAGAAGFWQIMKEPARQYGLEVNKNIDERYNIEKSTIAACKYLKDSYKLFKDWALVALAYNRGKNGIMRDLKTQKVKEAADLYLNTETSRYLFRILACKYLFENPKRLGFVLRAQDLYPQISYREVKWKSTIHNLATWAELHNTSYRLLKLANPWLLDDFMLDKSHKEYYLKIFQKSSLHYDPLKTEPFDKNWVIDKNTKS